MSKFPTLVPETDPIFVSETRPKVEQTKSIETTVTYYIPPDEVRVVLLTHLRKVYPEFRRKGLEIEIELISIDGQEPIIKCTGYKHES